MKKLAASAIAGCCMVLLSGCQTTSPNQMGATSMGGLGPLFTPYPQAVTLSQSVQDAFYRTGDPVLAKIRVETNQTTVILTGYVKKIRQSDMAEQIAHQVPGVQNVVNNLIVRQ